MIKSVIALLAVLVCACGTVPGPAGCLGALNLPAARVAKNGDCTTSATSDRSTYAVGQAMVFTLTTVATGANCGVGVPCGAAAVSVLDGAGRVAWRPVQLGIACPAIARLLRPGESITSTATWEHPTLAAGEFSVTSGEAAAYFRVC